MNPEEKAQGDEKIRKILEFILENPNCTFRDLNRELTHSYNSERKYFRKEMSRKTLKSKLDYLLSQKHILSHKFRKRAGKKIPDNFTINEEKIDLYPNLIQKKRLILGKKLEDLFDSQKTLSLSIALSYLMDHFTELEILQNPKSEKFYFSDNFHIQFRHTILKMLYNIVFNNPDLWYVFQEPKDLDFSIRINVKGSNFTGFFKVLKEFRDLEIKDGKLEQLGGKETFKELIYKDLELYYAKAKFEEERRNELQKHPEFKEQSREIINSLIKNRDFEIFLNELDK